MIDMRVMVLAALASERSAAEYAAILDAMNREPEAVCLTATDGLPGRVRLAVSLHGTTVVQIENVPEVAWREYVETRGAAPAAPTMTCH